MKTSIALPIAVLALGSSVPALSAQTPGPAPAAKSTAAEEYVTGKGFHSSVFEVKHRDPDGLVPVLRPLSSGFKGSVISANRDYRTISVRDFPENVAAIEAAIQRLDVAEPARPDVELRLWVLLASNRPASPAGIPEELAPVVTALKSTLQYRNYGLAASFSERVRDGSRNIGGEGTAQVAIDPTGKGDAPPMHSEYKITQLSVDGSASPARIRLDGFSVTLVGGGRAQVRTDVNLREGEKVVVGTSTVHGKALAVVLSARVLR